MSSKPLRIASDESAAPPPTALAMPLRLRQIELTLGRGACSQFIHHRQVHRNELAPPASASLTWWATCGRDPRHEPEGQLVELLDADRQHGQDRFAGRLAEAIEVLQPKLVVIENVRRLLSLPAIRVSMEGGDDHRRNLGLATLRSMGAHNRTRRADTRTAECRRRPTTVARFRGVADALAVGMGCQPDLRAHSESAYRRPRYSGVDPCQGSGFITAGATTNRR